MDYSATIHVPADPQVTSHAIRKEMHIWWSTRVELGQNSATIRFNNSHVTFAFNPDDQAMSFEWPCTDANMVIDGVADTTEWTGTSLIWAIVPAGSGSDITLTHKGLNHTLACLDVCTRGWQHFFEGSLRKHLSGDAPTPETNT